MTLDTSSTILGESSTATPRIKPYPFTTATPAPMPRNVSAPKVVSDLRNLLSASSSPDDHGRPQVFGRDDTGFKRSAVIFNGSVKTNAFVIVKPKNAADVSRVVKYCRRHNLELSVKAGGNGVHGWSVAGHIILDLNLMSDVSVSLPIPSAPTLQESFESLQLCQEVSAPGSGNAKRASMNGTKRGSPDSAAVAVKRTVEDILDGQMDGIENSEMDGSRVKRRTKASPADSSRSNSDVGSRSITNSDSNSSDSESMGSNTGGQFSTGETSPTSGGSDKVQTIDDDVGAPAVQSAPAPRTTYVNPSRTSVHSYPFVPTTFGSSSNPAGFSGSYPGAFASRDTLTLNTNSDPPPYTIVTFGAGTHSKRLDIATSNSQYGAFYVPTSAYPVGAGQCISGGFGFIGRKHGLAMDNVVEAEVVLADGRIVWVGEGGKHGGEWREGEDPTELWWAVRGAGAVFGVVTRFRSKAYYLPSVYAGNFIYLFDRSSTPALLRHVRDCIKGSSRSLYANIIMTAGPPGAPAIVVIQLCFCGPRSEGEVYVQAIGSCEGSRLLFQDFSERPFERQQVAVEEVLKGGEGRKWFIKSDTLHSLSDDVIDQTCARFSTIPNGCTWLFEYTGGGAVADVKDSCYPDSHRAASFTVAALHQWEHTEPPVLDRKCVQTAEDWINEVIHPNSPGGPLPCFLQSATEEDVAAVYGEHFPRLRELKKILDPTNFFRHAMWPRPGAPDDSRQQGAGDPFAPSIDHLVDGQLSEPVLVDAGQSQMTGGDSVQEQLAGGKGAMTNWKRITPRIDGQFKEQKQGRTPTAPPLPGQVAEEG